MDMKHDLLLGAAELTENLASLLAGNVQSQWAYRHATCADSASPRIQNDGAVSSAQF
jgi:hypothetical protein